MKPLALLLLLASLPALGAGPAEVTAQYEVRVLGTIGARVHETYQRKGDTYTIESTSTTEGAVKLLRDETLVYRSSGRVGAEGLEPLVFERRQAADRSRDVRATFDWPRGIMRSEHGADPEEIPLPQGTQDRLSMMYQFMNMAGTPGATVDVQMSNGRKIERYTYRLVDEPRLKTPAGEFETLHYERIAEPGHARAELWLARDRFNLPVRVVFEDRKGIRLDQVLVALQAR